MIVQKILQQAKPYLKQKKVLDVLIGLELMVVQLDDGSIGLSYVLTDRLKGQCKSLSECGHFKNMPAFELAKWSLCQQNDIRSGLGLAVVNSVAHNNYRKDNKKPLDAGNVFSPSENDTVGFIGLIKPLINKIKPEVKKVIVFDQGKEDFYKEIYSTQEQAYYLPHCDIVYISGSTLINHSIDDLLKLCYSAREVIIVGLSTSLYPLVFFDSPVTYLAGMYWHPENAKEIFERVGQAAGMIHITHYGKKITLKIK